MPAPAGAGAAATRPIPYGAWRGGQRLEALSSSLGEVGANQGPFRPGRNLGAEEDAGLPIESGQVPPGATQRAGGLKSAPTWDNRAGARSARSGWRPRFIPTEPGQVGVNSAAATGATEERWPPPDFIGINSGGRYRKMPPS